MKFQRIETIVNVRCGRSLYHLLMLSASNLFTLYPSVSVRIEMSDWQWKREYGFIIARIIPHERFMRPKTIIILHWYSYLFCRLSWYQQRQFRMEIHFCILSKCINFSSYSFLLSTIQNYILLPITSSTCE